MNTVITVTGLVATTPRHLVTTAGKPITSFRLASVEKKFDSSIGRWVDSNTNWYTITTFDDVAVNVNASIAKGERIIVTGKLVLREHDSGDRTSISAEIEASALGHDLAWGTSKFDRTTFTRDVNNYA